MRCRAGYAAGAAVVQGAGNPARWLTARLGWWLSAWAKKANKIQLPQAAAEMLIEMIGAELGLLDQGPAKLAVTAGVTTKTDRPGPR